MSVLPGRTIAVASIAAALAFVLTCGWIGATPGDYGGLGVTAATPSNFRLEDVPPGSSLADAGLRSGETVRWAEWNLHTRAALLAPMVGSRLVLVKTDGSAVTLVAHPGQKRSLPFPIALVKVLFLLVAGLLAVRRWDERSVRSLIVFLFGFGLGLALSNSNPVASPELSYALFYYGAMILLASAGAAAADFSAHLSAAPRAVESRLSRASIASAIFAVLVGSLATFVSNSGKTLATAAGYLVVLSFLFAVATLVAGYVSAHGAERSRRLWVLVIVGIGLLGPAIDVIVAATVGYNALIDQLVVLTVAVIPVGLAYVILRHRLIDVGFVLNQAAIYAGVSLVVLGVFVIAETLLSDYLRSTNHVTSTAIQLLLALGIGYSLSAIHKRVERFVDRVLFRERHEAETALHEFSLEAAYVTEAPLLFDRCVGTLEHHSGATRVAMWMRDDAELYVMVAGSFASAPSVDVNDPAVLAMRARHVVVDLDRTSSALPGVLAFPMAASGELLGILVCDAKRNHETYAPDERASIEEVATSVAHAYSALRVRELQREVAMLRELSNAGPVRS